MSLFSVNPASMGVVAVKPYEHVYDNLCQRGRGTCGLRMHMSEFLIMCARLSAVDVDAREHCYYPLSQSSAVAGCARACLVSCAPHERVR